MIRDYLNEADNYMVLLQDCLNKIRAELPPEQEYVTVSNQTDLQNAVDNLVNKTIRIKPGVYDSLILRNGVKNLALVSDTTSLGSGRVKPEMTDALVKVKSFQCESKAEEYYLSGFELLQVRNDTAIAYLGNTKATSVNELPNKLFFNQVLMRAVEQVGGKRGFQIDCRECSITNSHISGFWYTDDSQAIGGAVGPGPFHIFNNYLEASGECFILGGNDPISIDYTPGNLTFTNNFCSKPLSWKNKVGATIKNAFELKNCRNALVENNVFERAWTSGQTGRLVLFSPRNQYGRAPYTQLKDIIFRWNVIRDAGGGVSLQGEDYTYPSLKTTNLTIENNLFYMLGAKYHAGSNRFYEIGKGPVSTLIKNNTHIGDGLNSFITMEDVTPDMKILNNLFYEGEYGLKTPAGMGITAFKALCTDGAFDNNVILRQSPPDRNINYGPTNIKTDLPIVDSEMKSLHPGKGVDIDALRQRVTF